MPLQATSGAASYDAFGGGVAAVPNYIEDVFSTFLRVSDGTNTQAIVNNIDLSTKGGLVWSKPRAAAGENHILVDSARGVNKYLSSDLTSAQGTMGTPYVFNTNGFTSANGNFWANGVSLVDWTFRKQPKFFDVVTYTGNGSAGRTVAHSLGSAPGCIIVKKTSGADSWAVYHRSAAKSGYTAKESYLILNSTQQVEGPYSGYWNNTDPTDTVFTLGNDGWVNANGATYVAYLFAHDAGGFGLTGTDNVISCGSATATGGGDLTVNLGYEPQWVMIKKANAASGWWIADNMRGWSLTTGRTLFADSSAAESNQFGDYLPMNATGFSSPVGTWNAGDQIIYIAIRRGPMKVPTSGTSVFTPIARTGTGSNATVSGVGFPPDLFIGQIRGTAGYWNGLVDRLRGVTKRLVTSQTNAEDTTTDAVTSFTMDGSTLGIDSNGFVNESGKTYIEWNFRRAPSFFDEVCYTGTGAAMTVPHNLGVAPELIILKSRNNAEGWMVYAAPLGNNKVLYLNSTFEADNAGLRWNDTTPTSSVFSVGKFSGTTPWSSGAGYTYVAYLFATCAGVSKVGSYTGNGSSQTINCGFTGGARFVMVKATSTTGNWIVADSARGIVAGNDPALYLNSTAAEVTGLDWIDADNSGFVVNETATIAANTNGVSYIFFAVA